MLYLVNQRETVTLDLRVHLCNSFLSRFSGAMFQRRIAEDEIYWFPDVGSVHTLWMAEPISLLYYGDHGEILLHRPSVQPYRLSLGPSGVRGVVELSPNRLGGENPEQYQLRFSESLCRRAGRPELTYEDKNSDES